MEGVPKIGNNCHGFYGGTLFSTLLELQRKKSAVCTNLLVSQIVPLPYHYFYLAVERITKT